MSGGHSSTTNGITVLGTGPSSSIIFERSSSSGKRSTTPKLQRSGSTLEILPNELEISTLTNSKIKANQQSIVAGFDSNINSRPSSRSSKKNGGDAKCIYSDSAHKKVVLPSVKRDFEKHGMPNNEEFEAFVRSNTPTVDLQAEKLSQSFVSSLETGIQGLGLETKSNTTTNSVKQFTTLNNDYYVSHHCDHDSSNQQSAGEYKSETCHKSSTDGKVDRKNNFVKQVTTLSDDYYVSHRQIDSLHSDTDDPSAQGTSKNDDDDKSSSESDNDDEEIKAPIELLGEFLEAVMNEDFENAQKLCQMILIYEPNNKEANEFKPLIDEELRKERERQLWGSSSSEEESSNEAESDDETDDSDDEDEDEDEKSNDTSDSN